MTRNGWMALLTLLVTALGAAVALLALWPEPNGGAGAARASESRDQALIAEVRALADRVALLERGSGTETSHAQDEVPEPKRVSLDQPDDLAPRVAALEQSLARLERESGGRRSALAETKPASYWHGGQIKALVELRQRIAEYERLLNEHLDDPRAPDFLVSLMVECGTLAGAECGDRAFAQYARTVCREPWQLDKVRAQVAMRRGEYDVAMPAWEVVASSAPTEEERARARIEIARATFLRGDEVRGTQMAEQLVSDYCAHRTLGLVAADAKGLLAFFEWQKKEQQKQRTQ